MWDNTLPKNRFLRFCILMAHRCGRHNVAMQSAALAFYLLFMIFPLLIFVSSLLGLLLLDVDAILAAVQEFLPREIVSFIGVYLTYDGKQNFCPAEAFLLTLKQILPDSQKSANYPYRVKEMQNLSAVTKTGWSFYGNRAGNHCAFCT